VQCKKHEKNKSGYSEVFSKVFKHHQADRAVVLRRPKRILKLNENYKTKQIQRSGDDLTNVRGPSIQVS